jgi:hypothetical protein
MIRLLSVDWDFFFPIPRRDPHFLYDWEHSELYAFYLNELWGIRAAGFLEFEHKLPKTSGDEFSFWSRFKFTEGAVVYFADSHSQAASREVVMDVDEVWNFDAHHDAYHTVREALKIGHTDASDWTAMYAYQLAKINTFYPSWWWDRYPKPKVPMRVSIDHKQDFRRAFDRVFICRSGAWTPTWVEDRFWMFLNACPVKQKIALDNMQRRIFDQEASQRLAVQIEESHKMTDIEISKDLPHA